MSMNISQVKKLRKIVRIKKLATKNNKIFVCTVKKTSVNYRMVLTLIPCFLFLCAISKFRKYIYAYRFQAFPKKFTDDYLSNHMYGQEARKVFIQHPWYNIEVFLKRTKDGGQSSTGTGLKLQGPSKSIKAQYSPSASAVFQMRFICLSIVYDANFQRF
jgi:hypothetical protein